jgi:allantoinase
MSADLVLVNGTVVTESAVLPVDIAVRDGRVVALSSHGEVRYQAEDLIDARGLYVLPGGVDPHVHFGDQGQSAFEDFETGTRAAAAGGITTVLDMPLNLPPTVDAATFAARLEAVRPRAVVDFGLWAGLVPGNLIDLPRMAALGAIAFKAFTCESADWFHVDDADLLDGMREAARLSLPVGVHCENNAITARLRARLRAVGRRDLRGHAESRPEVAEWEAIARVALVARVAGARAHIVHTSTAEGVDTVVQARRAGAPISAEVTMHHLTLDEDDAAHLGTYAKCAPPLRSRRQVDALWRRVLAGDVQNIGSDHSPATEEQKSLAGREHWAVPDGITGVQTMLPLLISEGVHRRRLPLERVATLAAANAARIFGLYPRKGTIQVGGDADFALVDLHRGWRLAADDLLYKCPWSPHLGWQITGRVVRTIRRGQTVFRDGEVVAEPGSGTFLSGSA